MKKGVLLFCTLLFSLAVFAPNMKEDDQIQQRFERWQKEQQFFSMYNTALDKLKEFEGLQLIAYTDSHGMSIGYGHFIERGEKMKSEITKEYAEELLRTDFEEAIQTVEQNTNLNRFDNPEKVLALAHFVFNLGGPRFKSSTLLKNLNSGQSIDHEIIRWNKARINGQITTLSHLTERRQYELSLFNSAT